MSMPRSRGRRRRRAVGRDQARARSPRGAKAAGGERRHCALRQNRVRPEFGRELHRADGLPGREERSQLIRLADLEAEGQVNLGPRPRWSQVHGLADGGRERGWRG